MKKYVLNTAALTIASLMAADATLATDAYLQNLFGDMKTVASVTVEDDGDIRIGTVIGGGGGGGAIDSDEVKQILGTGSVVGTPNLTDATTVSTRLGAALAVGYDAFNFAGGALPGNQSFTSRMDTLGTIINPAFVAGDNLVTGATNVLGAKLDAAFVAGAGLATATAPLDAALQVGQPATPNDPGIVPADYLGAVAHMGNLLVPGAGNLRAKIDALYNDIGAFAGASAQAKIGAAIDGLAQDVAGGTITSLNFATTALDAAIGAGVGSAVAAKPSLTRLTGIDDANNANPPLADSLSGKLSIAPANDLLAQAEARRAALHALVVTLDNGGAFNAALATSGLTFGGAAPANAAAWNAVTAAPASSLEAMIALF